MVSKRLRICCRFARQSCKYLKNRIPANSPAKISEISTVASAESLWTNRVYSNNRLVTNTNSANRAAKNRLRPRLGSKWGLGGTRTSPAAAGRKGFGSEALGGWGNDACMFYRK